MRHASNSKAAKRNFSRTAVKTKKINLTGATKRGGRRM